MYTSRALTILLKSKLPVELSLIVYTAYAKAMKKQWFRCMQNRLWYNLMGSQNRVVKHEFDDFTSVELYYLDRDDPIYALVYDGQDRYMVIVKRLSAVMAYY